ncbi:YrhB domain-containing protein [Streptomyces microflavus]|uniref:YrhB domain-containing protein n=1 Tax=Streptomyces microflavus TaxID=1919 RepID=UPI00225B6A78|nr:YrhB domain-containing protein [Streptomyces microflavus]MCX4655777.1 YrhB domain-containing protein [Streptomyces microflavus]
MLRPEEQAAAWLARTYRGLAEPAAPHPVAESATAWLMACRTVQQPGYPHTPMLAASVVVPKDGSSPFHPSPSAPLADLEPAASYEAAVARVQNQGRRINVRGSVVALDSAIDKNPSVPLAWQPSDEAPGWWSRLTRRYFPEFERVHATSWDEIVKAVAETGPDTRGLVWVRREIGGLEATGNLIYAHNNKGRVVFLDSLTSSLAQLDTDHVRELVLVRALPEALRARRLPWEQEAHDFDGALVKARLWLENAYGGEAELVGPTAGDETRRGWVFSCDSRRHLQEGRWQDTMLDASLVVPKDASEPFGLPNSDPWNWLAHWDAGGHPGTGTFPSPPPPGRALWFDPTLAELGPVLSTSDHRVWSSAVDELASFQPGSRALIWIRRTDGRGREAVGWLVNGLTTATGVLLFDGASEDPVSFDPTGVHALHVIRYR